MTTGATTIQTEDGPLTLQPVDPETVRSLARQWPMGVVSPEQTGSDVHGVVFQRDAIEVWGLKFQCVETTLEVVARITQMRRALIPVALARFAARFAGTLLAAPYVKEKGPDHFEHGLAVFMPPRPEKRADPACVGITARNADVWMSLHDPQAANDFVGEYRALFRALAEADEQFLGVDLRPWQMMGEQRFDFMLLDGRLVCLSREIDPGDPLWLLLRRAGCTSILHLPCAQVIDTVDPAFAIGANDVVQTTQVTVEEGHEGQVVLVPGLLCKRVAAGPSVGWDGLVRVQPLGCAAVAGVDPRSLRKLPKPPGEAELAASQRLWTERLAIAQRAIAGVVVLDDALVTEAQAKAEVAKLCQALRKVMARKDEGGIKGHRKKLARLLKVFLPLPDAAMVQALLAELDPKQGGGVQEATVEKILAWAGRSSAAS